MRKSSVLFGVVAGIALCSLLPTRGVKKADAAACEVYIGGMPAGFTLSTGGVRVIGLGKVHTESGNVSPATDAGIRTGDLIVKAAGIEIKTVGEFNEVLRKNGEKAIKLTVCRAGEETEIEVIPQKESGSQRFKIGVSIRDCISGVGTITYIDKTTHRFGALGHPVSSDGLQELSISSGNVYACSIVGVIKGVRGKAGELRGMFLNETSFGTADKICSSGIYGGFSETYDYESLTTGAVGSIDEAKIGKASVYSTIDGISPQAYSAEIVKIDKQSKSNKNYVIKITDKTLLEETGGIVQGMSGSPVLQDGKLIGAITHVFLNDPTRGYGIDVNTMLKE